MHYWAYWGTVSTDIRYRFALRQLDASLRWHDKKRERALCPLVYLHLLRGGYDNIEKKLDTS